MLKENIDPNRLMICISERQSWWYKNSVVVFKCCSILLDFFCQCIEVVRHEDPPKGRTIPYICLPCRSDLLCRGSHPYHTFQAHRLVLPIYWNMFMNTIIMRTHRPARYGIHSTLPANSQKTKLFLFI